jgi:hypothetical protein
MNLKSLHNPSAVFVLSTFPFPVEAGGNSLGSLAFSETKTFVLLIELASLAFQILGC